MRLPSVMRLLILWFLLFPPQKHNASVVFVGPNTSAPINEWQPMGGEHEGEANSFKTREDCETYRRQVISDARSALVDAPNGVANLPSAPSTVKWTFAL